MPPSRSRWLAGFSFPFESPSRRFQVVGTSPVVYSCAGGQIRRSTPRALTAANAPLANCPAAGVGQLLVDNVACGGGNTFFNYVPANATREGWVEIMLTLTDAGESVRLYDRVSVNNAP